MPHILPCPAPRVKFADSDFEITDDGRRRRRRRSEAAIEGQEPEGLAGKMSEQQGETQEEEVLRKKSPHECPVPKPRGLIGEVLGFKDAEERVSRPRIETVKTSRSRKEDM